VKIHQDFYIEQGGGMDIVEVMEYWKKLEIIE